MFDRFIRLARARKALQDGRFEEALALADDPWIRTDRRAEDVRRGAHDALIGRARDRLANGDARAALRDLHACKGVAAAAALAAEAQGRIDAGAALQMVSQRRLDAARVHAEGGRLQAARAELAATGEVPALELQRQGVAALIAARTEQAQGHLQKAVAQFRAGELDAAVIAVRAARAIDREIDLGADLGGLVRAVGSRLASEVGSLVHSGDELGALRAFRRQVAALPDLDADPVVQRVGRELAAALFARLAGVRRPEEAAELLQACADASCLPGDTQRLQAGADLLQRLPALRTSGRPGEHVAALEELARLFAQSDWSREAEVVRAAGVLAEQRVQEARNRASAGDLTGARAQLLSVLQEQPMHEDARSELEAIDRGVREREQRLDAARDAAKSGRLRGAYAMALAQAQPGAAGEPARQFAQDLGARMELVGRGLDQVRAALHGRTSGGVAGLRHCLLRLEELAKVQADHEEVPRLREALEAEIAGIECADSALLAAGRGEHQIVAAAVVTLVGQRPALLAPDRLDARILALVDALVRAAEASLAAGRLAECEACVAGFLVARTVRQDLGDLAERLHKNAAARRERAEQLAGEAMGMLDARDLAGAEQRCEAARQLWIDGSAIRRVEDQLQALRQQEARLQRVEAMAAGGDVHGAHAELGDMPPTPTFLRTRIFDMKQSLARAQGLEGAFLLRVDEGGEYVVLRGESTSIGNVRDGRADLPVLAAIAGVHARIQRSMSFHGGMEDAIVAEGGELRVGGQRVAKHRLRPGDRVLLGAALQIAYTQPSRRSLTAALQLLGGFQVAGTDRILLFKDRGRDGRILLGAGGDVHVRVPGATGEVELFANRDGQVRIRCDGGGEIDGRPFRGEHPVSAGAAVRAAGVAFVLLPWVRTG